MHKTGERRGAKHAWSEPSIATISSLNFEPKALHNTIGLQRTIKQFVLSNSLEFKCGRGFYEFTKPEIVSHKKEVKLSFTTF